MDFVTERLGIIMKIDAHICLSIASQIAMKYFMVIKSVNSHLSVCQL